MKLRLCLHFLVGVTALLVFVLPANATTRTVTNLNDSGAGSLRQAIIDSSSGDTINFAVTGTIVLTSASLDVNHNLTIQGPGADSLTIMRSSTSHFRIFYFDNGTWSLSNVTIKDGYDDFTSGGIYNGNGNLTVNNCVVRDNIAVRTAGGIGNDATTTLNNVSLINNRTLLYSPSVGGAAIFNGSTLTMTNCTLSDNVSAFEGGGIYNLGTLNVSNSTLDDNSSDAGCGGIYFDMAGSGCAVTNCTFTKNRGPNGDAIEMGAGTVTVQSCTFVENIASNHGAIYLNQSRPTLRIGNTILQGAGGLIRNNGGTITSLGYNLISDNGGGFLTATGDQINTDAKLDPAGLQNNGGATLTIALLPNSPAIDQGTSFGLTSDQRGSARPIDNPSVSNASDGSDIGAFEAASDPQQSTTPFLMVTTTSDHDDSVCGASDCTLREALQRTNTVPGFNTIMFASNVIGTLTLQTALGELVVTDSTKIVGPGALILAISGNEAHRVFNFASASFTNSVSGLTIQDGWNAGGNSGASNFGGGIYNQSSLLVTDCMFTNNFVSGRTNNDGHGGAGGSGFGGGIYNASSLVLDRCTFHRNSGNNEGNVAGGGQGSDATQVNTPGGNGGDAAGGALYNAAGASIAISNCTFNGNGAGAGRGGASALFFGGNGGVASGAICNLGAMGITGSTISGNVGSGGAGGTGTHGNNGASGKGVGGIASIVSSNSTVQDTVTAGNTGNNGGGNDVDGAFVSSGYNLIGNGDFSTGFTATGDQVGTTAAPINPQLGPLQNNGGPTLTMVPQAGSLALDRGFAFGLTNDQRGHARPFDDPTIPNAPGGDGSDIGAIEIGSGPVPTLVVSRKMHSVNNQLFDITLSADPLGDECRSGGANGNYTLIFSFASPVTFTSASVCTGLGTVSSTSVSGNQITINVTGVTPAEVLNICLSNVNDGTTSGNVSFPFRVLVGDTSGNGSVNASDISLTKLKSGQTVDATNFREDVTVSGSINASDVSLVKSKSGTALP